MELIKLSDDKKYILLKQGKGFFEIPLDEIRRKGGLNKWLAYLGEFTWFKQKHKSALLEFLKYTRITYKTAP